jgi:metal-responsive CopG/Arc/MetJ family transcriptional regulator
MVISIFILTKKTKMKERITITIDKELLNWLDSKIDDKTFANRSHGFEFLIKKRMDKENKVNKQ